MAKAQFSKTEIRGITCAVPRATRSPDYHLKDFKAEEIEKIVGMTGVRSRRIADENTCTSDLCQAAAERLLSELAWEKGSIDCLIFISQTPDYYLPATSCLLQSRLGLSKECAAFDINLGCSGYPYGLWVAAGLIESRAAKRVLLLVGDTISKLVAPTDRSTCFLFGDAGTATALEYSENANPSYFVLGSDGTGGPHLAVPAGGFRQRWSPEAMTRKVAADGNERGDQDLYMSGSEVFNFTLSAVPAMARDLLALSNCGTDTIDAFIFHQANAFMLKHLQKKLKLDPEKVPFSLDEFGNTSSASIPITLACRRRSPLKEKRNRVALFGFGVGFSWAAALLDLPPLKCVEVMEYQGVSGNEDTDSA